MKITGKTRQSGIELLRILTMLGVVILHYNDGRAFQYVDAGTVNQYILFFFESICIGAVDLFVLISGYFLSGTQKRNYLKPLELLLELTLVKEAWYLLTVIFGAPFSIKTIISTLVPNNYFVILYIALYVVSPYLNKVFQNFSKKSWNRFILVLLVLFSAWPTFVDLTEEIIGKELIGLSSIGMKGSQQGFNIVNFCLVYFIGAYLRHNEVPAILKGKRNQILGLSVSIILIFIWALAVQNLTRLELRSAWVYHNPLVILSAVLLLLLFRSMKFESRVVNELSKASFTCFLVHAYLLNRLGIEKFSTGNPGLLVLHVLFVAMVCYAASYIVYKIYTFATGWFVGILGKCRIFQPQEIE